MEEPKDLTDREFALFRELIHRLAGISLNDSKRQLVQSRLRRRLQWHALTRFSDYYDLVTKDGADPQEIETLVNCITTNKTDFFREAHHFEFVSRSVLPPLVERARIGRAPKRIRVWHAGCSTGEEPYTLAMTLLEALDGAHGWDIRLLASDIDTEVLAHAERGVYEKSRVEPVPKALLLKYFLKGKAPDDSFVKVRKPLREMTVFRQINLKDDPWPIRPGARFDMIFCRNVIIYFDKPSQKRLFARFAAHLTPGGYLFLGHSESLFGINDSFEPLGNTIYRLPAGHAKEAA